MTDRHGHGQDILQAGVHPEGGYQVSEQGWGNGPDPAADAQLPSQNPALSSVVWSVVFTAVFASLALAAFKRRSQD